MWTIPASNALIARAILCLPRGLSVFRGGGSPIISGFSNGFLPVFFEIPDLLPPKGYFSTDKPIHHVNEGFSLRIFRVER
jgi:hypothetical protein